MLSNKVKSGCSEKVNTMLRKRSPAATVMDEVHLALYREPGFREAYLSYSAIGWSSRPSATLPHSRSTPCT